MNCVMLVAVWPTLVYYKYAKAQFNPLVFKWDDLREHKRKEAEAHYHIILRFRCAADVMSM